MLARTACPCAKTLLLLFLEGFPGFREEPKCSGQPEAAGAAARLVSLELRRNLPSFASQGCSSQTHGLGGFHLVLWGEVQGSLLLAIHP